MVNINFIAESIKMATVLITGGTGLIGKELSKLLLQKGYEVIILTRKTPAIVHGSSAIGLHYAEWNTGKQTIDANAIQQADFIVHLAGAGVADGGNGGRAREDRGDVVAAGSHGLLGG